MSSHFLVTLLNELSESDKMRGVPSILSRTAKKNVFQSKCLDGISVHLFGKNYKKKIQVEL